MKLPTIDAQISDIFREVQFGDIAYMFKTMNFKYHNMGRDRQGHVPDEFELKTMVEKMLRQAAELWEKSNKPAIVQSGRFEVGCDAKGYLWMKFVPEYWNCNPEE